MKNSFKLYPKRPITKWVAENMRAVAREVALLAKVGDGEMNARSSIISSDGDVAVSITVYKDGSVSVFKDID